MIKTIDAMAVNDVAIDPTLAIHEVLLRSRNGKVSPGVVDYIDNMTAPEILAWASYGMAEYLGQSDELGSIEAGKLADFFLVPGDPTTDLKAIKTISMVMKGGTVYFPSEIYPELKKRGRIHLNGEISKKRYRIHLCKYLK